MGECVLLTLDGYLMILFVRDYFWIRTVASSSIRGRDRTERARLEVLLGLGLVVANQLSLVERLCPNCQNFSFVVSV